MTIIKIETLSSQNNYSYSTHNYTNDKQYCYIHWQNKYTNKMQLTLAFNIFLNRVHATSAVEPLLNHNLVNEKILPVPFKLYRKQQQQLSSGNYLLLLCYSLYLSGTLTVLFDLVVIIGLLRELGNDLDEPS